jgi:hypothetical protein
MSYTTRYFGEPWNPGIARLEPVATPIGQPCLHCQETIEYGDQGLMVPAPVHLECFLRMVVGSIAHQNRTCACFGGSDEPPPGLTRREEAIAAIAHYERHQQTCADDDSDDEVDTVLVEGSDL